VLETRLRTAGVVAVVRPPAPSLAESLAAILLDAGLGAIEVTFRAAGAPEAIARIRERVPGMLVGAGTVLTADQAREALAAGAQFVVTPGSTAAVIEVVLAAGTPMIPGVATPTEVEAALARGLQLLKLFPAEVLGGIAMLRALRGPYPDVRFVPTGGVSAGNLGAYLGEPNVVAVGGSWLTERLDTGDDLELVRQRAVAAAAIVAAVRPGVQPPG
jgi:2-dehydro-3-deoxyphosphogluconate aldolase/(4S)-4-hydroxy-2-oxoglutarate aldolase